MGMSGRRCQKVGCTAVCAAGMPRIGGTRKCAWGGRHGKQSAAMVAAIQCCICLPVKAQQAADQSLDVE